MDDSTLPAVYRRPPADMSEKTRRWCRERWGVDFDRHKFERASAAYEKPLQGVVERLRNIEV